MFVILSFLFFFKSYYSDGIAHGENELARRVMHVRLFIADTVNTKPLSVPRSKYRKKSRKALKNARRMLDEARSKKSKWLAKQRERFFFFFFFFSCERGVFPRAGGGASNVVVFRKQQRFALFSSRPSWIAKYRVPTCTHILQIVRFVFERL